MLGLEDVEVDKAAVEAVNMERMKNLKLDEMTTEMGDTVAKNRKLLWIGGAPTTGKTFTGDYLATRGWHHIDGDQGITQPDPVVREKFIKMSGEFENVMKGEKVDRDKWEPYFQHLIDEIKEAQKTHERVVLTFAVCELFGGEYELISSQLPTCSFVKLTADLDTIVERWL